MYGIIFDLNGTLVDSEHAHWMAYQEVLMSYEIDFTFKEFSKDWTRSGRDLSFTLKRHGREDLLSSIADLKRQKDEIFRGTSVDRVILMPGVHETLNKLSIEFKLSVDSTSEKADIIQLLRHFKIENYFEIVGSCDMPWDLEKYGKNTKASRFKYIADLMNYSPIRCLVVGDAEKDVLAAKKANMNVIIIPTESTKDNDFSVADEVLSSMSDLTSEIIRKVLCT